MTFEEFFTKKRIDLVALQSSEPGLFLEFKKHFEQMGEKSFDHTKKYWFNKLRLSYHLAAELKPEKVHIENQLAEQTITESILEEKMPTLSVGFKPRFKPGMASAAPNATEGEKVKDENPAEAVEDNKLKSQAPAETSPKPAGFTPRFKAGLTKAVEKVEGGQLEVEKPAEAAPKPAGFTPRFKAGVTKGIPTKGEVAKVEEQLKAGSSEQIDVQKPEMPTADAEPAKPVGFKPRFNMKMVKPKPPEEE